MNSRGISFWSIFNVLDWVTKDFASSKPWSSILFINSTSPSLKNLWNKESKKILPAGTAKNWSWQGTFWLWMVHRNKCKINWNINPLHLVESPFTRPNETCCILAPMSCRPIAFKRYFKLMKCCRCAWSTTYKYSSAAYNCSRNKTDAKSLNF